MRVLRSLHLATGVLAILALLMMRIPAAFAAQCHRLGSSSGACIIGPCTPALAQAGCLPATCEQSQGCPGYVAAPTSTAPAEPAFRFEQVKPTIQINIPTLRLSDVSARTVDGIPTDISIPWIGEYIAALYRWAVPVGAILATIVIMVAGVIWLTSGGAGSLSTAKEWITNAIIGLLLLVSSYVILNIINPDLVRLTALRVKIVHPTFISTENSISVVTDEDIQAPKQGTNSVPLFKQFDFQQPYGRCGTIKSSGCGPTSMAMVMKFYGASVDPLAVANSFAFEGYRACPPDSCECQGTAHGAFTTSSLLSQYGLQGEQLGKDREKILDVLRSNQPIIVVVGPNARGLNASGNSTPFTGGGHYIVLTGIAPNGNVLVNDPAKNLREARPDELFAGVKNAWHVRR